MENRSKFDLSHQILTTAKLGQLLPVYIQDVVPNDIIRLSSTFTVRCHPMLAPVMSRLSGYVRYYFIPYRLLIEDYTKRISNPDDPRKFPTLADYKYKKIPLGVGTLCDAFGITSAPVDGQEFISVQNSAKMSALPFLAYHLVYNYFYKDPVFDTSYDPDLTSQKLKDIKNLIEIQRVNWFPDYFISSKNTTQYGTEVDLDLDGNDVIKVNEMKMAERLQRLREIILQTGSNYIEYLRRLFGAFPKDYSLQQPRFLGGQEIEIHVGDIDQTVPSENEPLGHVGGKTGAIIRQMGFDAEFEEHGIVLGLVFFKPQQVYRAGIPPIFFKDNYYSMYNPMFANLGMQEISRSELSASNDDNTPFGYNERYAEYKYGHSRVCNSFAGSLSYWHFGRNINEEVLNNKFLECNPVGAPFAYSENLSFEMYYIMDPSETVINFGSYNDLKLFCDKFPEYHISDVVACAPKTRINYMVAENRFYGQSATEIEYSQEQWTIYLYIKDLFYFMAQLLEFDYEGVKGRVIRFDATDMKRHSVQFAIDASPIYITRDRAYKENQEQVLINAYHNVDALRPIPKSVIV